MTEEGNPCRAIEHLFVLVGGWPGFGKTTLARALAREMGLPLLAKDNIEEALADALGRPTDVAESQRLGRAAVRVMLRVAQGCPGAVMDSTWFPEVRPLVTSVPGQVVEVRCIVPKELARARYYRRAVTRHEGHLDLRRTEEELWGSPSRPLGVGPVVQVDTTGAVDITQLTADVLASVPAERSTPASTGSRRRRPRAESRPYRSRMTVPWWKRKHENPFGVKPLVSTFLLVLGLMTMLGRDAVPVRVAGGIALALGLVLYSHGLLWGSPRGDK